MVFLKRLALFFLVNFFVVLTITFVIQLLGLDQTIGSDVQSLFIFCLGYGMLGAFVSLLLSRTMVKWMMRIHLIDPNNANLHEQQLYNQVKQLCEKAGLKKIPQVGIFKSTEMNAFATGPSKNKSLVAVSTALLEKMDTKKQEAILGHEIGHIMNGDMVTMSLIQGIINAFVMFFARLFAFFILSSSKNKNQRVSPMTYYFLVQVFQVIFALFGFLIVAKFSRWREFRADALGARYTSKEQMIGALESLKLNVEDKTLNQQTLNAFKIDTRSKWSELFSTHPPLEKRIEALKQGF